MLPIGTSESPAAARPNPKQEIAILRGIYASQLAYVAEHPEVRAEMAYLGSKFAMDLTLERQLRVIDMVAGYLQGRILEWGCQHGLDSCVFRMRFGDSVELHSCDIVDEGTYKPFNEFSGTRYKKLTHSYRLEYGDNYFDVVLSNGVLEHVPDDLASIREIARILKPGGTFIITMLPNRWSYTEALARLMNSLHHDRLYTVRKTTHMLSQNGFEVVKTKHFFMVPTMLGPLPESAKKLYQRMNTFVWLVNDCLERIYPLNRLSSNLLLIARKM